MLVSNGFRQTVCGLAALSLAYLGCAASYAAPNTTTNHSSSVTSVSSASVSSNNVTSPTYLSQYSNQQNPDSANIKALSSKCTEGDAVACKSLGHINVQNYHKNHDNVSLIQNGYAFFERGCALRDIESCYMRGLTLIEAQQHDLDIHKVFKIVNIEATLEDSLLEGTRLSNSKQASDAFAFLAEMYQNKDNDKTINYARQGCDLRNNDACYLMGVSLWLQQIEGKDVSKYLDGRNIFDVLVETFQKGTQANRIDYCSYSYYFLGYEYNKRQMYDLALKAFQNGCDLNNNNACFFTGIAYEDGLGTIKDMQKAYNFYNKSCTLGSEYGCERVRKLHMQGFH